MFFRIVLLAFVAFLSAPLVQAQPFTFGPKAGFNFSQYVVDESSLPEYIDLSDLPDGRRVGFAGGIFMQFNAGFLNLQPEMMFSQHSTQLEFQDLTFADLRTVKFNQIDVPLLAGLNIGKHIRLQAGPVMTYVIDVDVESGAGNVLQAFVTDFENKDWGYQAGVGLDLGRLQLDARWAGPLMARSVDFEVNGIVHPVDFRRKTLQVTAGISLIK